MTPTAAWIFLIFGFVLPLAHVLISPRSGSWTVPKGAGCPIGARWGWLVIILFLGPVGWLMYMRKRGPRPHLTSNKPADPTS
ncbi:MAG: hypothetical protein ISR51_04585 [Rhodospirillales bacterium]|nr:hypothetical protein [Alphaproteobacteria bacterium]MBL6947932.1 hypothetical protein [Rhodospirillales bacterium]